MDRAELVQHLSNATVEIPPEVEEAVQRLRRERWRLYMRLRPVYFCPRPRPELVGSWRREASGSVASRLALGDYDEALDLLLDHVNGAASS